MKILFIYYLLCSLSPLLLRGTGPENDPLKDGVRNFVRNGLRNFVRRGEALAQLPDTDIWLLDIKDSAEQISFHHPVNITNRKGYDNQPVFSPNGKYILYSSQPDSGCATDIYKYDLKTKTITQFTKTQTSEYSPTFMPDGKNISVVMVEKDSVQRLWKFPLT